MYRVLIFSDSRYRDAFGSAWLAYNIHQEVPDSLAVVASFNYWRDALESINPHVVIINHIQGKRNKMIADHVKRHGGLVVVQHNEGVIEFSGREEVFAQQKGAKNVDLTLCWNDITAGLTGGVTIGCPRFDIYIGSLREKLIDSRSLFCDKYGLDQEKEIILFGSSYPSSKFTYMLQSFHQNNWKDLGNTKAQAWQDPNKFAASQQYEQNKFMSIMLSTMLERKNSQIIFSPHPMSDIDKWRRWCIGENIVMVDQEYVFNSLNAADLYVGKLGSIAVAEAWLLGTPAVKYSSTDPSASSADQAAADYLNGFHITETVEQIMSRNDWRGVGETSRYPGDKHIEYLDKWGINPSYAGNTTATMIADLLEEHKPETVGAGDYFSFLGVTKQHDKEHEGYTVDSYGNHNKAVRQWDVINWYDRLTTIFG